MQQRGDAGLFRLDVVGGAALDALHRRQAAVMRDVGRFRRPGREGAGAGNHQVQPPVGLKRRIAVGEQPLEEGALLRRELALQLDEMAELGRGGPDVGIDLLQLRDELGETELGDRARSPELEDFRH